MSAARPVRRDVGWYALATVIPALLGFAGVALLVRLLGQAAYGQVSVVMGAALMIAAYASGWVAQAVLRFHSGEMAAGRAEALERTAGALQLRAILGFLPVLLIWLLLSRGLPVFTVLAGCALFVAATLYQLRLAHAQADFRPGDVMRGETARAVALPLAAGLAAWAFGGSVTMALVTIAAGYVGAWLLLRGSLPRTSADPAMARRIWSYGWPIGLWLGFSQLLAYFDRYLVAMYQGYDDAGRYSAGFELVRRGLVLALAPITLAVHPALVALWSEDDHAGAQRLWRRALLAQAAAGAAIVALYVPLAGWIQQLAFGFALAWPVNLSMAVSGALWALALIAHKPLELELRTRTMLAALAGAAGLNVIGNILLVPRHGYPAAAHVSAVSAGVYLLLVLALPARTNVSVPVGS